MQIVKCAQNLPYARSHVASLAPARTPGSRRRPPTNRLIEALCEVDIDRLPEVVSHASLLPAAARDEVLGIVVDVVGWMLDLADKGVHRVYRVDRELMMEVLEPCRCGEEARHTRLPAAFPLFCSEACLHEWAEENARDLPRLEGIDELLEKTEDEAHARGVEETEAKLDRRVEEGVEEAMDTDDNPLLNVLRRFGSDPHLSVEKAAWRLECGLRSGKIVL